MSKIMRALYAEARAAREVAAPTNERERSGALARPIASDPIKASSIAWWGRVPAHGVSPQPGQAEMRGTQRATAESRVGTVSLSVCRPSSCM